MRLQEELKVTPLRWDADRAARAPSGPLHGSSSRLEKKRPRAQDCPGEGWSVSAWAPVGGWVGEGCVCMCSAPYGRKKRPRSVGIIFPIRVAQSGPDRRESTEGDVDGSRMVSDGTNSCSHGRMHVSDRQAARLVGRQTGRLVDRQTGWSTGWQAGRQTGW